jgi:formylglycine-generating enzyme required for sulfatase activity
MTQVWIPAGQFTLGSPSNEKSRSDDEDPVEVTVARGFWLGRDEVTQSQWKRLMQTLPWNEKAHVKEGDDFPATYVSWLDAMEFCRKLTENEHKAGRLPTNWEYTLPTEAQWEYACRAGTATRFSFGDGDSDLSESAWFVRNAQDADEKYAHAVGQKKPNRWGLRDMHGNVCEWCRDVYAKVASKDYDQPEGPHGSIHVVRGGSWGAVAGACRSAARESERDFTKWETVGFRLACRRLSPGPH